MARALPIMACVLISLLNAGWDAPLGDDKHAAFWLVTGAEAAVVLAALTPREADSIRRFPDRVGDGGMFGPATLILGEETLTQVLPAARLERRTRSARGSACRPAGGAGPAGRRGR